MVTIPIPTEATLGALVVTAALWDLWTRRIPNWLVLAGIVAGFGLQIGLDGLVGLRNATLGMGLAAAVYIVFFALRAMGAGDVKLMMAVGALAGPSNWLVIFLLASILGGMIALVLIVAKGTAVKTVGNALFILGEFLHFRAPFLKNAELDVSHPAAVTLPHGVSIALGSLLFMALTNLRP